MAIMGILKSVTICTVNAFQHVWENYTKIYSVRSSVSHVLIYIYIYAEAVVLLAMLPFCHYCLKNIWTHLWRKVFFVIQTFFGGIAYTLNCISGDNALSVDVLMQTATVFRLENVRSEHSGITVSGSALVKCTSGKLYNYVYI